MRTTRNFAIGLVTALTFASCTTELPFNQAVENAQLEKEVSFWAYHSDGDTKSVLGDGGSVLWSPNDSICVYFGSQYQQGNITKFVSDNSSPASSARFTGKMPNSIGREGGDGYYYAFYPYDKSISFLYNHIIGLDIMQKEGRFLIYLVISSFVTCSLFLDFSITILSANSCSCFSNSSNLSSNVFYIFSISF